MKFLLLSLIPVLIFLLWKEFDHRQTQPTQTPKPLSFAPDSNPPDSSKLAATTTSTNKKSYRPLTSRLPASAGPQEKLAQWLGPYQSASGLNIRLGSENQVTLVSGLKYPAQWKNSEDGLNFAQTFASQLGIPKEQIALAQGAPPETDVTEVFKFGQVADEYPVFNSFLQITQARPSGDVYLVVNELKNLGTPDLSNNYTPDQIENILKEKYGQDIRISPEKHEHQIFSTSHEKSELARAYTLNMLHPKRDRRYVLISTKDGRILFDQSLVTH
ncbi:MAG: hypothetical protein IPK04_17905 [Bdellovibrionales bacterium]|nr:hypothetical protein [Bdellovibrionales bacterium]